MPPLTARHIAIWHPPHEPETAAAPDHLLLEDGGDMLLEDGGLILLEANA